MHLHLVPQRLCLCGIPMGKSDCQHENTSFKLDGGVYFLTITIMGWKHVFIKREYLDFIIDSLKFYQDKRDVKTVGYCLMPNHLHWIFKLSLSYSDIVKILRTIKSFTATQLLKRLNSEVRSYVLPVHPIFIGNRNVNVEEPKDILKYFSYCARSDIDQLHRFWQRESDIKLIDSYKFLIQKLRYIHNNPIREKWELVKDPVEYPYSSCRFYENSSDWNGLHIQSLF